MYFGKYPTAYLHGLQTVFGRVSKPFARPLLAAEQHQVAIVCVFFGRPKWTHFSQTHLIFCPQDPQLTAIELPKKGVPDSGWTFFLLMGTGYLPMFQRVHVSRSYQLHWEGLDSHDNDRMVVNCQNPLLQTPVPQTCGVVMGFCQRLKLNNTSSGLLLPYMCGVPLHGLSNTQGDSYPNAKLQKTTFALIAQVRLETARSLNANSL